MQVLVTVLDPDSIADREDQASLALAAPWDLLKPMEVPRRRVVRWTCARRLRSVTVRPVAVDGGYRQARPADVIELRAPHRDEPDALVVDQDNSA